MVRGNKTRGIPTVRFGMGSLHFGAEFLLAGVVSVFARHFLCYNWPDVIGESLQQPLLLLFWPSMQR